MIGDRLMNEVGEGLESCDFPEVVISVETAISVDSVVSTGEGLGTHAPFCMEPSGELQTHFPKRFWMRKWQWVSLSHNRQ